MKNVPPRKVTCQQFNYELGINCMVFYGELCHAASGYTLRLQHTKTKIGEAVEDEAKPHYNRVQSTVPLWAQYSSSLKRVSCMVVQVSPHVLEEVHLGLVFDMQLGQLVVEIGSHGGI